MKYKRSYRRILSRVGEVCGLSYVFRRLLWSLRGSVEVIKEVFFRFR